ncbi:MAG: hypothetical protein FJX25_13465 [Alphaproteobacteria bacterium]|nr:hypothetical protein [Alphaproteobacteria bacterium]
MFKAHVRHQAFLLCETMGTGLIMDASAFSQTFSELLTFCVVHNLGIAAPLEIRGDAPVVVFGGRLNDI